MTSLPIDPRRSQRGSVLLVSMIFAILIGISLTTYVSLTSNALKLANRSFYANAAINLTDLGVEQAIWALNHSDWTGFTASGSQYQGTFPSSSTSFTLSGGVTGQVKVWVDPTNTVSGTTTPHAVSRAIITLQDGSTIEKWTEAYIQQRSYNSQPMVARTGLDFVGNVTIDAWDSHSDTTSTADDVAYSTSVRDPNAGIASDSVAVDSISLQNADIYGRASVGTSNSSGISVGSGGRLAGSFSAGTGIDYSRVTYDFTTSFPDISAPTGTYTALGSMPASLPVNAGDPTITINGVAYYAYSISSFSLSGNDSLTITAGKNVIIYATGTSGPTIQTGGNAAINIGAGAKLNMYTAGTVDIDGNGVQNGTSGAPNDPINLQIFGTRTAAQAASSGMQSIGIKGNGYLSAVVNAPNANVQINGNAESYGAIMANYIKMNGNGNFHADESLQRIHTSGIYGLTKWRELYTTTDRATYASQLSF